ncbi:hypothetical protein D6853_14330 [Butyrivibrio sp. X503]|uniref:hypothetical protein n=1 Tax=Butyrivibrio sp. X503 TaxID=2364878 RepID=UPI000EAA43EC|nr:hypothetical protein [Butyrivibrio sp. X503]RKM54111.1 hypothetical protein D6853_14330 [Butyrivibrio sp. X503]
MKLRSLTAIIACGLVLCACSNETGVDAGFDSEQITAENGQETGTGETDTEKTEDAETADDTSSQTSASDKSGEALYESFLNNETKVLVDTENDFGEYISLSDVKGKECTLDELKQAISDAVSKDSGMDVKYDSVKYSYIDCGADGVKELALDFSNAEEVPYSLTVVVKEYDGALKLIYSKDSWDRYTVELNEYGAILGSGNDGWGAFSTDKSFIDADGEYHFIYRAYVSEYVEPGTPRGDLRFNGTTHTLPQDIKLDDSYAFLSFDFNNTLEDDSDNVYTYSKIIENAGDETRNTWEYYYGVFNDDDSNYDSSNAFMQFLEGEGLKPLTLKEVDKKIADKEASEGLTDKINSGSEVKMEDLK